MSKFWSRFHIPKEKMHWETRPEYGGSEHRLLVRDRDGKVIVTIIHGSGPDATWGVYKNGAGYGDYVTEEQAKKFAEGIACTVKF